MNCTLPEMTFRGHIPNIRAYFSGPKGQYICLNRRWRPCITPEEREGVANIQDVAMIHTGNDILDARLRLFKPLEIEVHRDELCLDIQQDTGNSTSMDVRITVAPGVFRADEEPMVFLRDGLTHTLLLKAWKRMFSKEFDPFDL